MVHYCHCLHELLGKLVKINTIGNLWLRHRSLQEIASSYAGLCCYSHLMQSLRASLALKWTGPHIAVIEVLQVICADANNLSTGTGGLALSLGCQLGSLVLGCWGQQQVSDATSEAAALQENGPQPTQAAQQVSCRPAPIQLLQQRYLSELISMKDSKLLNYKQCGPFRNWLPSPHAV